jgi:hypothetical protein
MAFFSKNQCYDIFLAKTSSSRRKTPMFSAKLFGENILRTITSVPGASFFSFLLTLLLDFFVFQMGIFFQPLF